MRLYPTSSKTGLLLQCSWPFGARQDIPKESVGEAALYGTDYHALAAHRLSRAKLPAPTLREEFAGEVARHIDATIPPLEAWLEGKGWRTPHEFIETAWLYHTHTRRSRQTSLDIETHHYHGHAAHEIGGTVDFAAWDPVDRSLLILDHKTGELDPGDPAEHSQLHTLAVIVSAFLKNPKSVTLALHWAPRRGLPEIRAKVISPARLESHTKDLRRADDEIGSDRLRVGPECAYCPARHQCPTRTNALALFTPADAALTRPWTPAEAGFVHERLAFYRDMARMLEDKVRATVVEAGVAERPDGKVVRLEPRPFSNLSLASIHRALPKDEAEALIDELGSKGCIETSERLELRARKPPKEV